MLSFIFRSLWIIWSWLELTVFTLFLYILAWLPSGLLGYFYHPLFRLWCASFVRALGVDLRLHEQNARSLPEQFILISNHPSAFEDVGIPSLFDVYPLAKEGVRHWFIVGKINQAAGTMFVKRDDKDSRNAAFDSLKKRLDSKKNVVLFPEGGCKGRRIHSRFEYGAFDLSLKTDIPIIPVFIHYEAQETFEWRAPQTLLDKMWHFISSQNNKANYYVYDAIFPSNFTDKQVYMEHVHNLYMQWQARHLE